MYLLLLIFFVLLVSDFFRLTEIVFGINLNSLLYEICNLQR